LPVDGVGLKYYNEITANRFITLRWVDPVIEIGRMKWEILLKKSK
jgi:hypothetical protein